MVIQDFNFETLKLYDTLMKAYISKIINEMQFDDTDLKQRLSYTESAITTLNGEEEGSVKKQIIDGVAKIIAGAPEARDTFKEINDWIDSHADSAAAMNS